MSFSPIQELRSHVRRKVSRSRSRVRPPWPRPRIRYRRHWFQHRRRLRFPAGWYRPGLCARCIQGLALLLGGSRTQGHGPREWSCVAVVHWKERLIRSPVNRKDVCRFRCRHSNARQSSMRRGFRNRRAALAICRAIVSPNKLQRDKADGTLELARDIGYCYRANR